MPHPEHKLRPGLSELSSIERLGLELASDVIRTTSTGEYIFLRGVPEMRGIATRVSTMIHEGVGRTDAYYKIHQLTDDLRNRYRKFQEYTQSNEYKNCPRFELPEKKEELEPFIAACLEALEKGVDFVRLQRIYHRRGYGDNVHLDLTRHGQTANIRYDEMFDYGTFEEPHVAYVYRRLQEILGHGQLQDLVWRRHDFGGDNYNMFIITSDASLREEYAKIIREILLVILKHPRTARTSHDRRNYRDSFRNEFERFAHSDV